MELYAAITNMTFHVDTPTLLSGVVVMPDGRTMKDFSLSPAALTDFEIANQLWAAID